MGKKFKGNDIKWNCESFFEDLKNWKVIILEIKC